MSSVYLHDIVQMKIQTIDYIQQWLVVNDVITRPLTRPPNGHFDYLFLRISNKARFDYVITRQLNIYGNL